MTMNNHTRKAGILGRFAWGKATAMIPATALALTLTMFSSEEAQACINENQVYTSSGALFSALMFSSDGFCSESVEEIASDKAIYESWGHCVNALGTSTEKGRLIDGWRDWTTPGTLYPYTDTGGSLKNRRKQASYADAIGERAGPFRWVNRTSNPSKVLSKSQIEAMFTRCNVPGS